MTVTCPKCSKSLKVKDEFAGKMLKCPQCKATFKADPKGLRPAGAAALKVQPKPGEKKKKEKAGVAINWVPLVIYGLLSLIPIAIILFIVGPMGVKRHWDANQEKVNEEITDVVEFALRAQASQEGSWNPRKSGNAPHMGDLRLLPEIFHMSTPENVRFDGFTSNGEFTGTYTFETGEVDVQMKLGGLTLPSGIHIGESGTSIAGGIRQNDSPSVAAAKKLKPKARSSEIHITGRVKNGQPSAELDGKKAEIYYPPELDEDGNIVKPAATPATPGAAAPAAPAEPAE